MRKFKKLIKTASEIEWAHLDFNKDNAQDKFSEIWEDMKKIIEGLIALRVTGNKTDRKLEKLVKLGDQIYEGDFEKFPDFTKQIRRRWGVSRAVLNLAIMLTNVIERPRSEKAAEVLEEFIEIGDWISGTQA
jgi:hypothetical protein